MAMAEPEAFKAFPVTIYDGSASGVPNVTIVDRRDDVPQGHLVPKYAKIIYRG